MSCGPPNSASMCLITIGRSCGEPLSEETLLRTTSKTRFQGQPRRILTLISLGLLTILIAVVLMNLEQPRTAANTPERKAVVALEAAVRPSSARSSRDATATVSAPAPALLSAGGGTVSSVDISALSIRRLLIPVAGVSLGQLNDSFYDARSEGRIHKAMDIMAPRDTPVLATDDGKVVKLHQSERGGISLYQSDTSSVYVYFYGHLTRYAEGISEGKPVRRGEVIAFVGDTGNAGAGNCHLHFGISKVTQAGRWSGGEPINPYPILTGQPAAMPSIEAGK
jgi:peptidoglycan LD-endopeptidase LytH